MMLDDLVAEYRTLLSHRHPGWMQQAEFLIDNICASGDSQAAKTLFLLLRDDEPHDELMYVIIHRVESILPSKEYVQTVIECLPELLLEAPDWATVIHFRLLNNPTTLESYKSAASEIAGLQVKAIHEFLSSISQEHSEFKARCDGILSALNSGQQ